MVFDMIVSEDYVLRKVKGYIGSETNDRLAFIPSLSGMNRMNNWIFNHVLSNTIHPIECTPNTSLSEKFTTKT